MIYKIQPGVVLTNVCGEYLLIATRQARGMCPHVQQLNATGGFYWKLLEEGKGYEEMIQAAQKYYNVEQERLRAGLSAFLEIMCKQGFLVCEEMP